MGVVKNISYDRFPKQGDWLHKEVLVSFEYNSDRKIKGIIVREDMEEPGITLIMLEDKRIVIDTECQYYIVE